MYCSAESGVSRLRRQVNSLSADVQRLERTLEALMARYEEDNPREESQPL